MKKPFYAVSLIPSLLIATSVVFASNGSLMQLSDVSDSVDEILQEYKAGQVRPEKPGEKPGQHPPKPGQPNQPTHPTHPPKPDNPGPKPPKPPTPPPPTPQPPTPQPPKPVDTTHAYNAGVRDGSDKGDREGKRKGHEDGVREGEREGRRNGNREGDAAGRAAGKRDGYGVDQAAGTLNGSREGQSAGITNGTAAGERRCYDEGYSRGYNAAYAEAEQMGQQDSASYDSGYAKGQADAAVMEAQNGHKAGYQVGFSQRETEIQNSFPAGALANKGIFSKSLAMEMGLPLELVSKGYNTPEEQRAYEKGYKEGYDRAYRRSYSDSKRRAYDDTYRHEYRRAYDYQYSISYRVGYTDGREEGYQDAYGAAYNSAYNAYFAEYKNREYSDQRSRGLSDGRSNGQREGFEAGCAQQTQRGYKAGYADMAAQVYPGAFESGKQAGVAAADKHYAENSVLKVFDIAFYDANSDGKFEAGENVMLRAEVRNFGFQGSDTVAIIVRSQRGEITLLPDLSAAGVSGRSKAVVNINVGQLHDVVAPDADSLTVTFMEKGREVGDYRQMYTRTNPNKVGVVIKDGTDVTKKATWFFPGKITELNQGDKVIITETKGDYYKVRKSAVASGDWSEGYIKSDKLNLQ